jgi:DNA-directed RNA polymerase specialized sigma24 family protein
MCADFPATRWSLIARLPDQPLQAAVVLGLYADAIGAYLARRLSGERAELVADVVQEVLTDLLGRSEVLARAQPSAGGRFRYWVMDLAWASARNALRRLRRHTAGAVAVAVEHLPEEASSPDHQAVMDRVWAWSVVQQAFDEVRQAAQDGRLDPLAAQVLEDHLVRGEGLRAITRRIGMPLATASRHLAAARRLLQSAIAERLRLAGELAAGEDDLVAGERLLESLRT